jgi:uncharacterized small protein (DUF1192 family)
MATKTRGGSDCYGTAHIFNMALTVYECCVCNVVYGVSRAFIERRQEDGETFYCPNGHHNVFSGPTELERTKTQLRQERERLAAERAKHDQTKASLTATKAAKTRFKNERDQLHSYVGAGVCPVPGCRRHFQNLAAHMERKHPSFREPS